MPPPIAGPHRVAPLSPSPQTTPTGSPSIAWRGIPALHVGPSPGRSPKDPAGDATRNPQTRVGRNSA
jgi:hypothetical protein